MNYEDLAIQDLREIVVSDRVKFSSCGQDVYGHVVKKGDSYAHVVSDGKREFRVPYAKLYRVLGASKHVFTKADRLRLRFSVGDFVSFKSRDRILHGSISRLNPKRAHVVCPDGQEYFVLYELLRRFPTYDNCGLERNREDELTSISIMARELMAEHGLDRWSFQFDNATKRAGCCYYDKGIISLSQHFAMKAAKHEVRNTILHEIAHALVGRGHHHNAIWKAKAVEIGSTGERCHDIKFMPPRYIMKCENNCWKVTVERRSRGRICKKCKGKLVYSTYTNERWNT